MIFMNATLKNITAMLIFGSIGLFVRNIELASSQIALVRGFVGAFILLALSQQMVDFDEK